MPHFEFIAKDHHGKNFHGTLFSATEQGVYFTLENLGYVVLSAHEKDDTDAVSLPQRITPYDVAVFTKLLSTVISAGMPIIDALAALEAQLEKKVLKRIIRNVRIDVEHGMTLSEAMAKHPKAFPYFYCNMVRSGEVSGIMPTVLNHLSNYLDKNEDLKRKITSATTYPKIVATMTILSTIFLVYYVIPKFVGLYKSNPKMVLPLPTKILIAVSNFAIEYYPYVIAGVIALLWAQHFFRTSDHTKRTFHPIALKIPVAGKINSRVSITRMTRTFSYMLQSGVPILSALEISKTASNNIVIEEELDRVIENVETGGTISGPLKVSPHFPPIVIAMIASGERTGTLGNLTEKCADALDSELEYMIKRMLFFIEPMITVLLTLFVAMIAASLYLPIFYLIGSLGG